MSQQLTPSALAAAFCPRCPGPTVPHRCGLRAFLAPTANGKPGLRSGQHRGPASSTASTSATSGPGSRRINSLGSTQASMRQPQERGPFLVLPEGASAPGWIRGCILGKGGENFRYIEEEAKGAQLVLEGAGCTRSAWNTNPSATTGPLRVRILGRKGANLDVAVLQLQQLIQHVRAEYADDAKGVPVKLKQRSDVPAAPVAVREVIEETSDTSDSEDDVDSHHDVKMLRTAAPPSSWEQCDEVQANSSSRLRPGAGGDVVAERARAWREKVAAQQQSQRTSCTSKPEEIRDAWETPEVEPAVKKEVAAPKVDDRLLHERHQLQAENRQLREQLRECMAKLDELSIQHAAVVKPCRLPVDDMLSGNNSDDEELSTSSGTSSADSSAVSSAVTFSAFLVTRPLARRLHEQTCAWRDSRYPPAEDA
eukprot:TRINITY_DN3094_c0_g2_i1.p1 TRINITY_DN3094_c0_g2~~TRINITY_DN3094_c0_g2_i1.p1  ORF type:complete len:424 (-),score=72.00 TRINITY_DN3094_c0_g2_i1:389-1660(-)